MTVIEQIQECIERQEEYRRLIEDIDLMRLAYLRSIATEMSNIKELKKILDCKDCSDQREEKNDFFNFQGAWELEKKKVRIDTIDETLNRVYMRLITYSISDEVVIDFNVLTDEFKEIAEDLKEM